MAKSTRDYWKGSQSIVVDIADEYKKETTNIIIPSEYDVSIYWVCYTIASFLYLLGWLAMAWLTIEVFRLLISVIF